MPVLKRIKNLASFGTWPRLSAVLGLLSSDDRHKWIQTIGTKSLRHVSLEQTYPWFSFPSIKFIENLLTPEMRVFEYGSGYSTLWWAKRVADVISVERSREWLDEVESAVSNHHCNNVRLAHFSQFVPGTEEQIRAVQSAASLPALVHAYSALAAGFSPPYDVVVVDDIFRNEVVAAVTSTIKPGGLLILDDSERARYKPAFTYLDALKWNHASFYGPSPYHFHEKQTTIWLKPTDSCAIA